MKVAIVGSTFKNQSQQLRDEARKQVAKLVTQLIQKYGNELVIVSGGAEGVDTWAEEFADWNGIKKEIYRPKNKQWAPDGYKDRNLLIANACDELYRIYYANTSTWGSGFTMYAVLRQGKSAYQTPIGTLLARWECSQCDKKYAHFRPAQSEASQDHKVSYFKARGLVRPIVAVQKEDATGKAQVAS